MQSARVMSFPQCTWGVVSHAVTPSQVDMPYGQADREQCRLSPPRRRRLQPLSVGPINGGKLIGSNSKLWSFANKAARDIHSLKQGKLSCNYDTALIAPVVVLGIKRTRG